MSDEATPYEEWLTSAIERDERDRASGLSPLPRSDEEREAMYLSLPREMRRQKARRKEWAVIAKSFRS